MNSPLSLVVLISGNGSNLQSIIDAIENGKLNAEIKTVISNNPEAFGLTRARTHGIATRILNNRDFAEREQFDRQLKSCLQSIDPDFILLAGFMRILGADLVNAFENRILNIHPSLLPAYKGLNTYQRALDNGESEHGVSIHLVTAALDDGPILMQGRYPIEASDQVSDLQARGHRLEHKMYPQLLRLLCEQKLILKGKQIKYERLALQKPLEFSE